MIPPVSIGRVGQLSQSIIGSYSELRSAVMSNCIVGSDASFRGMNHSLNIGDTAEIEYS